MCQVIVGMHVFTGCDNVSGFKGRGKVKAYKHMAGSEALINAFQRMGCEWQMDFALLTSLEEFTCALYGEKLVDLSEARYRIFTLKHRVDEALPPTRDCFKMHAYRSAYQAAIYRRCLEQFISAPDPVDHGWKMDNGNLVIDWMKLPPAPPSVLQNVHCKCKTTKCNAGVCGCLKAELPCTDLCQCEHCENYSADSVSQPCCSDSEDSDEEIE